MATKKPPRSRSRSKAPPPTALAGFWFDEAAADRAVQFFEKCLTHTKGELAGQPLLLDEWEKNEIIRPLFGWKRADGTRRYRKIFVFVARKNGKALAVDTPIPTPHGWTNHGDLRTGDLVYDGNGGTVRVLAATPAYEGPCRRVVFADGGAVVAHDLHEWITDRGIVETAEMARTLRRGARGDFGHHVRVAGALVGTEKKLLVDPYVLGVWLGDGATSAARVTCADAEIVARLVELGEECRVVGATGKFVAPAYAVGAGFRSGQAKAMTLQARLRAIEVLGHKHIPDQYLRASIEQRRELLRGLIDTDGFVSKAGQVVFTNTCKPLIDGLIELVRSLGLKPTLRTDRAMLGKKDCGQCWDVQFWPPSDLRVAYVERKQERIVAGLRSGKRRSASRAVVSASPVGQRIVNCIQVEGGVYLAGRAMVPTHNSTLCAGIALYLLHADREMGAEVYSAAADREQAAIVFDVAKQMVSQSRQLRPRTEVYRRSMVHLESASSYKVLSADAFSKHGLNASGIIVDEVHAQRNRELIDVLSTSVGSRRQPIEVYITTAGFDRKSICWELYDYAVKVRDGIIVDDAFLPVIFEAKPKDDWTDERVWAKANPGLGSSIKIDYLRAECKKAQEIAAYENTFKRLHLNLWTQQENRWLQVETLWDPCGGVVPPLEMMRGRRAWIGVDLSSTTDITAVVAIVEDPDDPAEFDVVPFFFVPEERIEIRAKRDRVPYDLWREQEFLIATEGNVVDYEAVRLKINELGLVLDVQEVAIDRWNSTGLQTQLTGDGFTVAQFGQGFASMSAPTKQLEVMLLRRELRHGMNPVLRWMAGNVAVAQDPAGNMKPAKDKSTERIDGIVALVMAIGRAIVVTDEENALDCLLAGEAIT